MIRRARLAAAAAVLLLVLAADARAAAKAEFPEIAFDAGQIREGTDVEHEFLVLNTGDEPLHITDVTTTCGCTVVDYDKVIPPGGSGAIRARIKTKDLPSGRASKTLTVNTDAPGAERTVLQVKLDHVPPIEFGMQARDGRMFMAARAGEAKEEKVLVRPHVPGMKITGVSSTNPLFVVALEPATPGSKKAEGLASMLLPQPGDVWVSVKLRPDAPAGVQSADIVVKTSDPQTPKASFKVQANVRAEQQPS